MNDDGIASMYQEVHLLINYVKNIETALHLACQRGDADAVTLLIKSGANVNLTGGIRGNAALHIATEHKHIDLIRLLPSLGSKVSMKNTVSILLFIIMYYIK